MNHEELLTTKQVASQLGLRVDSIYRLVKSGRLQASMINDRNLRFKRSTIEEFINELPVTAN